MRKMVICLALCFLMALFTFSIPAWDEDGSSVGEFKIKQIKTKGFTGQFIEPLAWVRVDDGYSLMIVEDYDEWHDLDSVRSFKLTAKDRARKSTVIYDAGGGKVRDAAGFWFSGNAPFIGSALIILAVRPEGSSGLIQIVTLSLDGSGKRIGDPRVVAEFTPPADSYFNEVWLSAGRRELTVGIIVGLGVYETTDTFNGSRSCKAYCFELNADGTLRTPAPVKIGLPNGGDYRHFRPYEMLWDGSKWMLPAVMTMLKFVEYAESKDYSDITGYQLYTLTATPSGEGDSFKFKTKRITRAKSIQYWSSFPTPVLLPTPAATAPGAAEAVDTMTLIYTLAKPKGSKTSKHHAKLFSYYVQELNADGSRKGKKQKAQPNKWVRQFTNETGLIWETTQSYYSNAFCGSDGNIYIAHARGASFYRTSDKTYLYEFQLDYYSLNPQTLVGELKASSNYQGKWLNGRPLVRRFGSVVSVINQLRDEKQGVQEDNIYISRF